jgi:hypothetical protein
LKIERVVVILEDDRNAVEGAANLAGLALGIEGLGGRQGLFVGENDGVERRALFVVGRDAGQVGLREFF